MPAKEIPIVRNGIKKQPDGTVRVKALPYYETVPLSGEPIERYPDGSTRKHVADRYSVTEVYTLGRRKHWWSINRPLEYIEEVNKLVIREYIRRSGEYDGEQERIDVPDQFPEIKRETKVPEKPLKARIGFIGRDTLYVKPRRAA